MGPEFAGCYWVSDRIVSKDGFLERWWAFAFLPFPPRSLADLERIFWQLINVFNSPSGIVTPLGVLPSAFIACGLFLLGALRWAVGGKEGFTCSLRRSSWPSWLRCCIGIHSTAGC